MLIGPTCRRCGSWPSCSPGSRACGGGPARRPPRRGRGPELALLDALAADAAAGHVAPHPLTAGAVGALLAAGLGRDPEPEFVSACHRATAGNPFLVGQLVAALAEDGVAPTAGAGARIETLGARWAGRWILGRLGRLPPPAQQLARALAVLEHGELAHAAALAGLDEEAAVAAADALRPPGSSRRDGRCGSRTRSCAPASIRSWARPSGRPGTGRAARVLAAAHAEHERVAEHLLAADPAGDPWVVDRLVSAAAMPRARARPSRRPSTCGARSGAARVRPPARRLLLELGMPRTTRATRAASSTCKPRSKPPRTHARGSPPPWRSGTPSARQPLRGGAGRTRSGAGADLRRGRAAGAEDATEALAASVATFSAVTAAPTPAASAPRAGARKARRPP